MGLAMDWNQYNCDRESEQLQTEAEDQLFGDDSLQLKWDEDKWDADQLDKLFI